MTNLPPFPSSPNNRSLPSNRFVPLPLPPQPVMVPKSLQGQQTSPSDVSSAPVAPTFEQSPSFTAPSNGFTDYDYLAQPPQPAFNNSFPSTSPPTSLPVSKKKKIFNTILIFSAVGILALGGIRYVTNIVDASNEGKIIEAGQNNPVKPIPLPTKTEEPVVIPPEEPEPVEQTPIEEPPVQETSQANVYENSWKGGSSWKAAPAAQEQLTSFNDDYNTANEWLASQNITDINVVYTNDPTYNCGAGLYGTANDWTVGCYHSEYGKTLFLWWGSESNIDARELVLLHEYSHYIQQWDYFDASVSASDAGLGQTNDAFYEIRETDATCRVYYQWNYTNLQYLDEYNESPCGDTNWSPTWYTEQVQALGVTIVDW